MVVFFSLSHLFLWYAVYVIVWQSLLWQYSCLCLIAAIVIFMDDVYLVWWRHTNRQMVHTSSRWTHTRHWPINDYIWPVEQCTCEIMSEMFWKCFNLLNILCCILEHVWYRKSWHSLYFYTLYHCSVLYFVTWYDDCDILTSANCSSIFIFIVSNFVIALIFLGFHEMPVVISPWQCCDKMYDHIALKLWVFL